MRYFLELAYNGTRYSGYQAQRNQVTVQGALEQSIQLLLQRPTKVVGCGRTDAGVHALQYFIHFDVFDVLPPNFLYRLNRILGKDILCYRLLEVAADAHTRFDATSRSYRYVIDAFQNPFHQETAYYCHYVKQLELAKMQEAAQLLLNYEDFTTFCKSRTDTKTNLCALQESYWEIKEEEQQLVYHVRSNRFLRGMIRLIVGMCLNVGKGTVKLAEVKTALDNKKTLERAFSAPATGLFLTDIRYDFIPPRRLDLLEK
ncbi:MAG: tRNA pseudouridine(38-40) synthase TruA [Aureispira sp.]